MAARNPEILGRATFDQHHGITVSVIFRGLKGEPIEKMSLGSTVQAMELAESIIRSARQATNQRENYA